MKSASWSINAMVAILSSTSSVFSSHTSHASDTFSFSQLLIQLLIHEDVVHNRQPPYFKLKKLSLLANFFE